MFDFILFALMIGITACCIERASKETSAKWRFYQMLPVILMFILLGFNAYTLKDGTRVVLKDGRIIDYSQAIACTVEQREVADK